MRILTLEKNILDTVTNDKTAAANLNCVTPGKRKTTKEQVKVITTRKRATSFSDSSSIVNVQQYMEHINPAIPTKTGTAF